MSSVGVKSMCTLGIKASNLMSMLLLEVIDEGKLKKQFKKFGQSRRKVRDTSKGDIKMECNKGASVPRLQF